MGINYQPVFFQMHKTVPEYQYLMYELFTCMFYSLQTALINMRLLQYMCVNMSGGQSNSCNCMCHELFFASQNIWVLLRIFRSTLTKVTD